MITFSSAVDYLLDNGYLAVINGEVTITGKFKREFNPVPKTKVEQIFKDNPEVVSREAIWKKFIEDAKIPYQVTATDGKKYTIRQFSAGIADKLIKIIKEVDYGILTRSTEVYYTQNGYKKTLKNYLIEEVWREAYEDYARREKEGKLTTILAAGSGGNRFED